MGDCHSYFDSAGLHGCRRRGGRGGKVLHHHPLGGPAGVVGRALHRSHEACRAAAIGQRVGALLRQQRGQVQRRVGVVRMHLHATRPGRFEQPPGKGQALGAAHADVQFEVLTRRPEHFGHGQQRRQADAAGQQQVPRRRTQGKQVARRADSDPVARLQVGVQPGRAAPAGGLALHRDQVAPSFAGRIAQRVAAPPWDRPGRVVRSRQVQVDVRAGLEGRQLGAVGEAQLERDDVVAQRLPAGDDKGQRRRFMQGHGESPVLFWVDNHCNHRARARRHRVPRASC
jgi:hypothetical protein